MVTFAQLKAADAQPFRDAAKAYGLLADKLLDRSDDVARELAKIPDVWDGIGSPAATAAIRAACTETDDAVYMLQRCDQILADLAGEVDKAKSLLHDAIAQAEAIPAVVREDGTVFVKPEDGPPPGHPAWGSFNRASSAAAQAIADAVQYATTADTTATTDLGALVPGSSGASYPADKIPPRGTDPGQVKAWWDSLTPEQRQFLIAHYPDKLGWLDGVPAVSRDQANRLTLTREQHRIQGRLDELKAQGQEGSDEYKDLKGKLDGLNRIEQRLLAGTGDGMAADGTQGDNQRAYLLGIDTSADGKAIVAVGNPDTADNIVTYVPGTGADLSKVNGDINRVDRMVFDASQLDPGKRTAGILWLGYDAPDTIVQFPPGGDATDPKYAKGAGADLDLFQDGLRATNTHHSTNSIIGHSYGSTVVGYAAKDHGLDVDNAIFVGSPGVGVERASDLGLDPNHVYSSHAKNDPIQYALDPGDLVKNAVMPGGADQDLIHGHNPSAKDFGGHRFQSDNGTPLMRPEIKTHTYDPLGPFGPSVTVPTGVDLHLSGEAHSQYWDDGNESRDNVAKIVTGHGNTITGDYR